MSNKIYSEPIEWHHVIGKEAFDGFLEDDYMLVFNGLANVYEDVTNSRALTVNVAHEAVRNTVWISDEAERELLMKTLDDKRRTYHRTRHLAGLNYSKELTP